MPVTFTTAKFAHAVITSATGTVSYSELIDHIEAKVAGGVMTFPELFDARNINVDLSQSEMRGLTNEIIKALNGAPPGRTAVVTGSAFHFRLARTYAALSRDVNSDLEVFSDFDQARAWLLKRSTTTAK